MSKHIAVLLGGWSAEREVSLNSGAACADALERLGYKVSRVDVGRDVAKVLAEMKPDAVFNALHGRWGEDGCVQGVLEVLDIPYTHSGVLASALAMHKPSAKHVFEQVGIPVADGGVFKRAEVLEAMREGRDLIVRPYVVKPINEGSSVGVSIIRDGDNFHYTAENWPFGGEVLIEQYIPGREVQVAVLDGKALGAIEIRALSGFYDYEAKYTDGKAEHLMPAPIPAEDYALACELAELAHNALGCRGLTRSDFRYDDTGEGPAKLYILETNTQPGMTRLSLSPEIAAHAGISFEALVERLVQGATTDSRG